MDRVSNCGYFDPSFGDFDLSSGPWKCPFKNIWKLHNKEDICNWYHFLNKDLSTNNTPFFHYETNLLNEYLNNPSLDEEKRLSKFSKSLSSSN